MLLPVGVSFADLEFRRVDVRDRSTQGTPFIRSVPVGMPRIPDKLLDNVFYLYKYEDDARIGEGYGGTGFIVSIRSEIYPQYGGCCYAVTNWHVACRDGYSIIRLNTKNGGSDIFPFEPHEWTFDPRYDIAVCELSLDFEKHKLSLIGDDQFITDERIKRYNIGLGDDVFMIGRFIDHDGGQTNRPTARFGSISLMPSPVIQPNHAKANSYCVDLHSRSGYSGSPVFAYRTISGDLELSAKVFRSGQPVHPVNALGAPFMGFLGIHWGQFPEMWRIEHDRAVSGEGEAGVLITEGQYVKGVSGMTCVLPASCILEVLNMPKLRDDRQRADREWAEEFRAHGLPPDAESEAKTEENPRHREDFSRLVSAASKAKPKDDRT